MSPLRDQIEKTVQGYLDAFNTNTPDGTIAHRAPDCTHRIVPPSPQFPTRSNEEYKAFMGPSFQLMKNFHLKLADGEKPIIDDVNRRAVLYLTSSAETPLGPYDNNYVFTLSFSEDGTQITDVLEFIDTKVTGDFVTKMMAFAAEHAQQ